MHDHALRQASQWMRHPRMQRIVGRNKLLRRWTIGLLARLELLLLAGHKDRDVLITLRACRGRSESLLTGNEAFLLYALARAQCGLGGAIAELGVYEGSSALILCEAKGPCPLHLFDTFAGLPPPSDSEATVLAQGQFSASLAAVRALLAGHDGVHFHVGLFPDSGAAAVHEQFNLVHLDVDLYSSTLAGLEFFYPRMVRGGIIITHDYSMLPGVAQAMRVFLADKPERLIELPTTQAMLVKL